MKINTTSTDSLPFLQILQHIDPSVRTLHYIGSLPKEQPPTVAIVGTRKPTAYGKEVAYQLSNELARHGVMIVSGLALGIDGIAHQAALDVGGKTIAVLAGGLDAIYPARHRKLAIDIINSDGAIVSEQPEGTPSLPHRFLERNRIVSGLADAVIIIEASARSGTLSTARWALEQGKTLMAVPGNITSQASSGCNQLLKAGAMPVTETKDVLQVLGLDGQEDRQTTLFAASPEEQVILDLIKNGERDGETLQQKSGLAAALFQQTMTMLEITGKIRALGANQWALG